jgi:hypothetical protein
MAQRCSRTGKQSYFSKLDADLAITRVAQRNTRHRKRAYREEPMRSYRCEFCGCWHLSSQRKRSETGEGIESPQTR